jgi:7-carboxy-7-deazaguanine synthase (Cx14CxxC type)
MSYAVKELFFTLQGEGAQSGRAAVFLRFTGCNLWSGREEDRGKGSGGCARWCDTDFVGTDGDNGGRYEAKELSKRARALWDGAVREGRGARPYIVCTGGEPSLQLDEALIDALHAEGFEVAIETNGTRALPRGIDWVCVSPKAGAPLVLTGGDELKLVYPQGTEDTEPERFEGLAFRHFFVQAMDRTALNSSLLAARTASTLGDSAQSEGDRTALSSSLLASRSASTNEDGLRACVALCQQRPRWRLSLQTHKLAGIP